MCGICGEFKFDDSPASVEAIAMMTERMSQRGPDASGLVARGRVAFGHRRLRIIDLSQRAEQPMVDAELGLGIVYNGAIYNYRELRKELEGQGHRFFSDGDTEVLLKAYHAWGERFVERLNGMFAFAIHERDSGRVVLGRDRLGIKPLYYAEIAGGLRFASSLPALIAPGGVDTALDPVALHHYMTFHAVVPAPFTLLRGVRKLPPATLVTVERDGTRKERKYWKLDFVPRDDEAKASDSEWRERVLSELRAAVARRMIADVPVGVLLSGGLDSSLVVALLAEAGHEQIETFSIGFEPEGGQLGDEFQYSDLIVERFHTRHHKISVGSSEALDALPRCIAAMNEPMVSHDAVGFYLLSREVSRHVKVVESGQGADEIFGGYHWYPPLAESRDPVADYARVFFDRDHAEMRELFAHDPFAQDHSFEFVRRHFAEPGAGSAVDKALRLDTTVMLVDDPVKRVDNMTMAWGLEARVPFLDHELCEVAARAPFRLKLASGGKGILKDVARPLLPSGVIDRPKGYFPVPALSYLRGPYLELVRDALSSRRAKERALYRPSYLENVLERPDEHITPLRGSKPWQLAVLELWLQANAL
jgi:asparagine synthase (glutamine-hydrolysing)